MESVSLCPKVIPLNGACSNRLCQMWKNHGFYKPWGLDLSLTWSRSRLSILTLAKIKSRDISINLKKSWQISKISTQLNLDWKVSILIISTKKKNNLVSTARTILTTFKSWFRQIEKSWSRLVSTVETPRLRFLPRTFLVDVAVIPHRDPRFGGFLADGHQAGRQLL